MARIVIITAGLSWAGEFIYCSNSIVHAAN